MKRSLLFKISVLFCVFVMAFSVAACTSGQNSSDSKVKPQPKPDEEEFIMAFGAIGDKHVPAAGKAAGSTTNAAKNFKESLEFFKEDPDIDTLVMVGDIPDYGLSDGQDIGEAFTEVKRIMHEVWGDKNLNKPTNLIYTLGNHEFYYDIKENSTLEQWKSLCEEFECASYLVVEGITFLSVDVEDANGGISKITKDFITEKLEESVKNNPNNPIFLSYHVPPQGTIMKNNWECIAQAWFEKIMKKYPQIVLLTAHTHYSNRHPATINQHYATTINVGTGTYGCVALEDRTGRKYDNAVGEMVYNGDVYDEGTIKGNYSSLPYIEGYNDINEGIKVKVYTRHIEVERLDLHTGNKIAPDWSFPIATSSDDFVYTIPRQKADMIIPELSTESCKVTRNGDRLHLELAPANDIKENVVDSYRIEVYCDGILKMDKNYVSDYWMHTDGIGDYNMLLVDKNDKEDKSWTEKALTLKIAATDGAGNISKPITIEVPAK